MIPSAGRIVHYNVPDIGWRPMMITTVAAEGSTDPAQPTRYLVSGWAKLDPSDVTYGMMGYAYKVDGEGYIGTERPVEQATEGLREFQWRWPPRV